MTKFHLQDIKLSYSPFVQLGLLWVSNSSVGSTGSEFKDPRFLYSKKDRVIIHRFKTYNPRIEREILGHFTVNIMQINVNSGQATLSRVYCTMNNSEIDSSSFASELTCRVQS